MGIVEVEHRELGRLRQAILHRVGVDGEILGGRPQAAVMLQVGGDGLHQSQVSLAIAFEQGTQHPLDERRRPLSRDLPEQLGPGAELLIGRQADPVGEGQRQTGLLVGPRHVGQIAEGITDAGRMVTRAR